MRIGNYNFVNTNHFNWYKAPYAIFCLLFTAQIIRAQEAINNDSLHLINNKPKRAFSIKGNVSITGLLQTGDENRFVVSALSLITLGNKICEAEPLTSLSYSNKPGKQVEGEYLENFIIRFLPDKIVYPAIAPLFERSYLKRIDYRLGASAAAVINIYNKNGQLIRFALGYNHEYTQYAAGAFKPEIETGNNYYARHSDQAYARLKGQNHFFKKHLIISYDFMYQPSLKDFKDYRWVLVGNIDVPIYKQIDFRASTVSSYETFTATNASKQNFRLTFGVNISFNSSKKATSTKP